MTTKQFFSSRESVHRTIKQARQETNAYNGFILRPQYATGKGYFITLHKTHLAPACGHLLNPALPTLFATPTRSKWQYKKSRTASV